jgi:hypothetical protein
MKQDIITGLRFRTLRFENLIAKKKFFFENVDFKKLESEESREYFMMLEKKKIVVQV